MPPTTCKELLKDYCANSSIAGIHYIADDTKHWIERLLWVVLVALSWYGSALLILTAWEAFVDKPISFVVETRYTDWDTKMPSVAICEISNNDKLYEVSDKIWTVNHPPSLEDGFNEIVYFRGFSYNLLDDCYYDPEPSPYCPMSNYTYYTSLIRSNCQELLKNCSYNKNEFSCCDFFVPIDTDMGTCFIINSIQTKKQNHYPMVSNNLKQKSGILKFEVLLTSTVYTLGEDEVPTITTLQSSTIKVQLGHNYRRQVAVRNIENDPLIVDTNQKQRVCRFYDENEGGLYPHYSYSTCTVLCRKRAQLRLCKCNDHFMLGTEESEHCNISGIACLHSYVYHLTTLKPNWASRPGLICDCLPSCDETEITIIKDSIKKERSSREKKAVVEIVLAHLPTERFRRNVVRSRLDLVVSIGGTIGLFAGASLISLVEFLFYFSFRFLGNLWIERRNRQNRNSVHRLLLQ